MCDFKYGIEKELKAVRRIYGRESLEQKLKYVDDDIKVITDNLARLRAAVVEQIKTVDGVDFRPFVLVERKINYDNKVKYEVVLHRLPNIPEVLNEINDRSPIEVWKDREKIPAVRGDVALKQILRGYGLQDMAWPREGRREFTGQERKAAFEYADRLAVDNQATIIKAGF